MPIGTLIGMLTYTNKNLTIHFGSQQTGFPAQGYYSIPDQQTLCQQEPFRQLALSNLITLTQTHSVDGFLVTHEFAQNYRPYSLTGDYLITNTPNIALGVATADCLPIVLHNPTKGALANIHAGWRGTVDKIVIKALEHMQHEFASNIDDIQAFFGPAARACCYEVQPDFLENFSTQAGFFERDSKLFFDVSEYNKQLLINAGVPAKTIYREFNWCTICDLRFCSYRRDKEKAQRQMTIVYLK